MHDATQLHRTLLAWYRAHARDLLWRRTRDPYVILLSEVMLQQTQADRVTSLLPRFLKRFPTIQHLARARRSSVIKAWQGMGYNRRAIHLHEAAKKIVASESGFPRTPDALRMLPGVGAYTTSALMCFAFGARVPVVDVNIRRVLSRLSRKRTAMNDLVSEQRAWELAAQLLPARKWYEWNQALMDIGARFCKSRVTSCGACPLIEQCPSAESITTQGVARTPVERTHKKIPLRIWRGKIVQSLRTKSFSSINVLGRTIDPDFKDQDARVIDALVASLVRDGLAKRAKGRISLA